MYRKNSPTKDNKNYYSSKNIFYPSFVDNCTWFVWGRLLEEGVNPSGKIPTSNAENWYNETKYPKGKVPKVGAVIVWKGGKSYHKASDGPGHVGYIEEIKPDGSLIISNSGTNMKFKLTTVNNKYKYPFSTKYNYTFDGFIYPPNVKEDIKPIPSPSPSKSETIYIVKKGDTLSGIAKRYNTTYQKLAKDNNIKDPNKIYVGQKIIIK